MSDQTALTFEAIEVKIPRTTDGRGPEAVPHPQHGGFTLAIPVPGTTSRIYEGWWKLKRLAEAALTHKYPGLASQARPSAARAKSVSLPLPR
jgi:hypothetical protein